MKFMKKAVGVLLSLVMVLSMLPTTVFATETKLTLAELREQYGAITIEAYTIGQGFLVEPTLYEKTEGLTTAAATIALLESKGLRYQGSESYFSALEFDDTIEADYPEYLKTYITSLNPTGDGDGFLAAFDYSEYAGWTFTIDDWFSSWGADSCGPGMEVTDYNTGEDIVLGDVIRWHFTVFGYGADVGFPGNVMAEYAGGNLFEQEDKTDLIFTLAAINSYYGNLEADNVYETALAVAADPLASADSIAAQEAALADYIEETFLAEEEPEAPAREAQDVSDVLSAAMAKLAATVTEPVFGSTAGEWTVFDLARGGHYDLDNKYFADYYDHIVATVNTMAARVDAGGKLAKNQSTENSRLIVALSAIGKDATSVGNWDLVAPYDDIEWVNKQGINGTMWALIALDSHDYTVREGLREELVEELLSLQHDDGGWSLANINMELASNVDVTGMVLTALAPYKNDADVAAAAAEAIEWLSGQQLTTGGFPYGTNGETSESCAWAIVALTAWGINPDTDERFIKDGKSAVDNLLSYYIEDEAMFAHQGNTSNIMGTEQAIYALAAYDRFVNEEPALFDFSDVTFEDAPEEKPEGAAPAVFLGLPDKVQGQKGKQFNATISIDSWDNEAGYKMIDFEMHVPSGLAVVGVIPGASLTGGEVSFHQDGTTLRAVYFDADPAEDYTGIEMTGTGFPKNLFTITFEVTRNIDTEKEGAVKQFNIVLTGMSFKTSSDSTDENSMTAVDVSEASGSVKIVSGVSFSAVKLYQGDGIDLIPESKMAVAVAVTGLEEDVIPALYYIGTGTSVEFKYSAEITAETGIASYIAMVDSTLEMESFAEADNYELDEEAAAGTLTFADSNSDGVINAQDALAAVNFWLRKTEVTSDDQILAMNVNGDSRLNTFDALGIVENFVNSNEFNVVVKAAILAPEEAPEE